MKVISIVVVILLVTGTIAFFASRSLGLFTPGKSLETNDSMSTSPQSGNIVIDLLEESNSGQSGTVTLSSQDGNVIVDIVTTGAPSGVTQPAHIHEGNCPEVGGVKYPLNFPTDGQSTTVLDVSLETLRSQLPLAVNIHRSPQAPEEYVSCGNLVF